MPTVNFFYQNDAHLKRLDELMQDIKTLVASELSCGDIQLDTSEVSVRLIRSEGSGMIADLEVEITAHAFQERVDKQDKICLRTRDYLVQKIPKTEIRVWLLLPQLGHSWEE
ncbi:MAG: hypothetical protein ACQR33_01375 [Candidatus Saccharibacteria bacterium]